jgi:Holliday junction resolvase-like predicted endonuclease
LSSWHEHSRKHLSSEPFPERLISLDMRRAVDAQLKAETLMAVTLGLLALSREGRVGAGELRSSLRITDESFSEAMELLRGEGLVSEDGDGLILSIHQRLGLAVRAIEAGAGFEAVSRSLGWLEFEEMAARIFEENGFKALRRFRFSATGRRWELDILAARAPYVVCCECKRWSKGMGNTTARKIIEAHLEKVEVFAGRLPGLTERTGLMRWRRAVVVPVALTLSATPLDIYRRVPSVSVLALPSFIAEFDGQLERLASFRVELPPPRQRPRQTVLRRL